MRIFFGVFLFLAFLPLQPLYAADCGARGMKLMSSTTFNHADRSGKVSPKTEKIDLLEVLQSINEEALQSNNEKNKYYYYWNIDSGNFKEISILFSKDQPSKTNSLVLRALFRADNGQIPSLKEFAVKAVGSSGNKYKVEKANFSEGSILPDSKYWPGLLTLKLIASGAEWCALTIRVEGGD